MNLDTRIKSGLRAAIEAEPANTPTSVMGVKATAERRRRRDRLVGLTISGLALAAVVFALTIRADVNQPYVANGEVLLSTDPVVVQGAPSPEPEFDTSKLGIDQSLTPMTDASVALAVVEPDLESATDGEVIRVTTLGTTVAGREAVILHAYQTQDDGQRIQVRCLVAPFGGTSCGGYDVQDIITEPGGLARPESPNEPSIYTVGGAAVLMWDVPQGTSVVVMTVNGEAVWQRPIAGVAVFDTDLFDGDQLQIVALDQQGAILASFELVARIGTPRT